MTLTLTTGACYYWRFKGEKAYRFGYCTHAERGFYRMGTYNGDRSGGVIVDAKDIEGTMI
jgi:hypothetical protein